MVVDGKTRDTKLSVICRGPNGYLGLPVPRNNYILKLDAEPFPTRSRA